MRTREEQSQSQTLRALFGLRGLIIDGVLKPGERVSELLLVDRLSISRTPARAALASLKEEGFLEALPSGGYAVIGFSERDVFEAIEIRGNLEGMAARFAAERGAPPALLEQMRKALLDLDGVVPGLGDSSELTDYVRGNERFHRLLIECAQSNMIKRSLERVLSLPFASPNAFVKSYGSEKPGVRTILVVAQEQHRSILEAIQNREGSRAQALTIEHSRCTWKYLQLALDPHEPGAQGPGLNLIRKMTG